MNDFTAQALRHAYIRNPKLTARRFREIENAAISAYYDLFLAEIGQPAVARAGRLYYLFRPDCVTEAGRELGLVECDECAYRLSEAVEHYLYEWWLYRHPEYEWTGFTESEALETLARFEQEAEAARLEQATYQIALF